MAEQEGLKKSIEISEAIKEIDVDEAVEYILSEDKKSNKSAKGKKETKKTTPKAEKIKSVEGKASKFTVSNKVVKVVSCDVTGEHGEYQINNGVIAIKGTSDAFVNIPAVQNWASDKRETLLKELDNLNKLEGEVIEVMKEFM